MYIIIEVKCTPFASLCTPKVCTAHCSRRNWKHVTMVYTEHADFGIPEGTKLDVAQINVNCQVCTEIIVTKYCKSCAQRSFGTLNKWQSHSVTIQYVAQTHHARCTRSSVIMVNMHSWSKWACSVSANKNACLSIMFFKVVTCTVCGPYLTLGQWSSHYQEVIRMVYRSPRNGIRTVAITRAICHTLDLDLEANSMLKYYWDILVTQMKVIPQ